MGNFHRMPLFRIVVPFEAVIHETLDSRIFTNIPDTDLAVGINVRAADDGYTAELIVEAGRPVLAKAAAIGLVERLLAVLASWNHGFQIRIGAVQSEVIDSGGSATVTEIRPGRVGVTASNNVFAEGHVQAVVHKASLDAEDAVLQRYEEMAGYVRSCLELNYLLVMSTRPPNRWLLAATGLEALAVGTIGDQDTVSNRLSADRRCQFKDAIGKAVDTAGLADIGERVVQRLLSTTTGPVADHVHAYLHRLGIKDTDPTEIKRWWRIRGAIAHGGSVEIEPGELNHLVAVFQSALRRTVGAEPVTGP